MTILLLVLGAACGGGGGTAVVVVAQPGRVVRGPQLAVPEETGIVIAWTSEAVEVGAVEYGETTAYGAVAPGGAAGTEHVVALTGLSPGTRYRYRILLDGTVASEGHEFRTVDPAAPVRFVAVGDSGQGLWQGPVAARLLDLAPDFVLHTGDVVYDFGRADEVDPSYFEPYGGLIDRVPFYLSLGNHDVALTDAGPLLDAVYLPGNERYYSFDRGDVHFIALDTTRSTGPGSDQHTWLNADLAASGALWKVVFMHYPPYSSSNHGSDLRVRADLAPLFEAYGVDLVLTGHDHDYERTYPLVAEAVTATAQDPDYMSPGAPVYVVTGGGGRRLYSSGTDYFTAASLSTYHVVLVVVDGARLDLEAVDVIGAVFDRCSITK